MLPAARFASVISNMLVNQLWGEKQAETGSVFGWYVRITSMHGVYPVQFTRKDSQKHYSQAVKLDRTALPKVDRFIT